MLPLALLAAFFTGVAIVYWILTPLQRAWWRWHDRRLAERGRWAEEDRRLLNEVRRICEPSR